MKLTTRLAQQSQTTRLSGLDLVRGELRDRNGGLTLSDRPIPRDLFPGTPLKSRLNTTTRRAALLFGFQIELLPLHSPLLGESLLVSFPRLINMLKFSRSSYLTSGQNRELNGEC